MTEELETKLLALKHKTKMKISALRQKYVSKLRSNILNAFQNANAMEIPVLSLSEALTKEYYGKDIKIIQKDHTIKQKISLKVGDADLSIGDYNSKEDGDLLEFVVHKYTAKNNK